MSLQRPSLYIEFPPVSSSKDSHLVAGLADIVNTVYNEAEGGIFKSGYERTNETEIAKFVKEGQLALAYVGEKLAGCVFVKFLTPNRGQLGMLALSAAYRGAGLGKQIVQWVEAYCKSKGCTVMQLEILVPTSFRHEWKERNQAWYLRMGYEITHLGDFAKDYPTIAKNLAGPAEYRFFEKKLI